MTFPETKCPLRTDSSFNAQSDEEHHKETSPLSTLNFGMVAAFPHDYMHLVCLGVTRKLLKLWTGSIGPLQSQLSSQRITQLSQHLLSLKTIFPLSWQESLGLLLLKDTAGRLLNSDHFCYTLGRLCCTTF